jgi:hypothetical protein
VIADFSCGGAMLALLVLSVVVTARGQGQSGANANADNDADTSVAAPQASQLAQERLEVPVELIHGLPIVEVKVNGAPPYKF